MPMVWSVALAFSPMDIRCSQHPFVRTVCCFLISAACGTHQGALKKNKKITGAWIPSQRIQQAWFGHWDFNSPRMSLPPSAQWRMPTSAIIFSLGCKAGFLTPNLRGVGSPPNPLCCPPVLPALGSTNTDIHDAEGAWRKELKPTRVY